MNDILLFMFAFGALFMGAGAIFVLVEMVLHGFDFEGFCIMVVTGVLAFILGVAVISSRFVEVYP